MSKVAVRSLLLCRLGMHEPGRGPVWNDGYFFGFCERCACDLIRRPRGKWKPVPRGYQVAWKPRPPGYPRWTVDGPGLGALVARHRLPRLRDFLLAGNSP